MPSLYLASASPRRQQLLTQIGVNFKQFAVNIDESVVAQESPQAYVTRLAREKAQAGLLSQVPAGAWVLGADTTVVLDGCILGKPQNQQDCEAMLLALSGTTHQVITAVALACTTSLKEVCVTSDVTFHTLAKPIIRDYWATGEPCDKAGSYAIQGLGAVFVKHLSGSYSAVVGLPVAETAELLQQAGIQIWQRS